MKDKYQKTVYACFVGYIVQAIVNNFVPLLFLTFEKEDNLLTILLSPPAVSKSNIGYILRFS